MVKSTGSLQAAGSDVVARIGLIAGEGLIG
jgi:hypothetical protein